ncbi:response regulator transcription factor [Anaerosporobacter sp.]|uniref:response regulator transcription factor n=1 Tax=Anaerosporobacter sp. TaxID=1872529 RepID=UPI00286EF27B|nr:response regulator [Anaerosporobacter sp.]
MKVFLVEDEVIVREGIKKNIDWSREGYEFVGEASDGELAYPMIQKLKPDIVITDIKMPFMNGLELSKLIKKEMPWVQIIVLSGYDEFEYAKQAITIGVTDYITKPVTGNELLEAVNRVKEIIESQKKKDKQMQMMQEDMQEIQVIKRQKFFNDLVAGKLSLSEILELSANLEIKLTSSRYNIILYKLYEGEEESHNYSEVANRMKNRLNEAFQKEEAIALFERENEETILVVMQEEGKSLHSTVEMYVQQIVDTVTGRASSAKLKYFVATGKEVERLSELPKAYEEACKAFAYRYILSKNQVVDSEKLVNYQIMQDSRVDISALDVNKMDKAIVMNFLTCGEEGEVEHFIEEYFVSLGKSSITSLLFRQYIAMDMYFCCRLLLEQLGISIDILKEFGDGLKESSSAFQSVDETITYMSQIFHLTIQARNESAKGKYRSLIKDATDFIHENFANEEMSLNLIASHVNVSPSHFSNIFSQDMGETFIEYLTKVRMKHAKEMLKCTSMKSSEIGYAIGYKDPHYFSYLFKKTQNCSPKEYRENGTYESNTKV